ncbi:hypothetical protein ACROYT_G018987 [Oculina patagonica]
MGSDAQRLRKSVYIFLKDYEALSEHVLGDPDRIAGGDLFGLWTSAGEPVIHVICGQHLCKERGSNPSDIAEKDFPLSHIGNWRYYDSSELLQADSTSRWTTRDRHKSSWKVENCNLEVLEDESPFKNVKGIEGISLKSRLKKSFDTAEQMELCSSRVSKGSPSDSPKHESYTSAGKPLFRDHVDIEEVPAGTGRKQSRALYATSNQRFPSDFASNRDFKVFMFKEDYQMMEALVLKYPNLETGGDLFGLWTSDNEAVLHIVLGPGRNCKRTGASFYQDIPYLQRNGELLTQDYMLCHIGEWHSHHQLRLFQPSQGDSSTVIRNYPRGTFGFLLIIANILSPSEVKLSPYLYTEKSTYGFDKMGKIAVMPNKNAFNSINEIKYRKAWGKEEEEHSQYSHGGFSRSRQSPPSHARGVRGMLARSPRAQKRNSKMSYRKTTRPVWIS